MVFAVTLPLGVALGFAFDKPTHTVEEVPVLKMVDVGLTDRGEDQTAKADAKRDGECMLAWDATEDLLNNLEGHNNAVTEITMLTEELYEIALENEGPTIRSLNQIRGDIERYKMDDWTRLGADLMKTEKLESTMRQCAKVSDEGN